MSLRCPHCRSQLPTARFQVGCFSCRRCDHCLQLKLPLLESVSWVLAVLLVAALAPLQRFFSLTPSLSLALALLLLSLPLLMRLKLLPLAWYSLVSRPEKSCRGSLRTMRLMMIAIPLAWLLFGMAWVLMAFLFWSFI